MIRDGGRGKVVYRFYTRGEKEKKNITLRVNHWGRAVSASRTVAKMSQARPKEFITVKIVNVKGLAAKSDASDQPEGDSNRTGWGRGGNGEMPEPQVMLVGQEASIMCEIL